jgi:hypothetical protein
MEKEEHKIKLIKHGGCEGCNKKCQFNGPTATPESAQETKGHPFDCNSTIGRRASA